MHLLEIVLSVLSFMLLSCVGKDNRLNNEESSINLRPERIPIVGSYERSG